MVNFRIIIVSNCIIWSSSSLGYFIDWELFLVLHTDLGNYLVSFLDLLSLFDLLCFFNFVNRKLAFLILLLSKFWNK